MTTLSAARRRLTDLQAEAHDLADVLAHIDDQGGDGPLTVLQQARCLLEIDAIAERLAVLSEAVACGFSPF